MLDKELLKLQNLEKIDDNTFILRKNLANNTLELEKNKYYIISVDNSDTASEIIETTRINWNSGQYLESNFLKCELVSKQGNMLQINACGYDPINNSDLNDVYLNFWINCTIINIVRCIS